ncbi:uncharacterized protein LOC133257629 [Bos javanicus]|uniref:uncharacterized protein LOC133257629 n=1 Tax=Bos javanicus TaxID=9906 RepID=UPI002AA7A266|nr:uncharacterized protein LOC133257629 [Bos javanicus]
MLVLMFIQGPRLVIWDLPVTLSSGQEPGPALAICVGESPASPSSVSGRTDTALPTAPSRGQRQKCRSGGGGGGGVPCCFGTGTAPPQLCPRSVCLEGAKGRDRLSEQGKPILLQNGEYVDFLKLHPSLCIFPPKTPKHLMEGNRANNPVRWLLSSPPILQRGKLRPGEVPRLRENSGLYFSGFGFGKKSQRLPFLPSLPLSLKFPSFKQKQKPRHAMPCPKPAWPDGQRGGGGRRIPKSPSLGRGPRVPYPHGKIISLDGAQGAAHASPVIRATIATAMLECICFHKEGPVLPPSAPQSCMCKRLSRFVFSRVLGRK